jgi:hypothetical protein
MIHRGWGFLAVVGFDSSPTPLSSFRSTGPTGRLRTRDNLLMEKGGGGGAKSYVGKKAWSSINRSILSDNGDLLCHNTAFKLGIDHEDSWP